MVSVKRSVRLIKMVNWFMLKYACLDGQWVPVTKHKVAAPIGFESFPPLHLCPLFIALMGCDLSCVILRAMSGNSSAIRGLVQGQKFFVFCILATSSRMSGFLI